MNITSTQLKHCRSIFDAEDIKQIAREARCSTSLIRNVLASNRTNDEIEYLCYMKAKEKAKKTLLIIEQIELQNTVLIKIRKQKDPELF